MTEPTQARLLLLELRDRYGADLPDEAEGLIDDYLCDAYFEGGERARLKFELKTDLRGTK